MEYDLEPKQAWRLAGRLLDGLVYDSGIEEKNEWVYVSTESEEHKRRFESWIARKEIEPSENIWILISHPAEDSKEMKWNEFMKRWSEFLSDTDIRITNKQFTWILEYKSQHVARFGRKAQGTTLKP